MDVLICIICIVCMIAVMLMVVFVIFSPLIKDNLFPPCVDCKHCVKYVGLYRCNNVKDKINGSNKSCICARGEVGCWFKKKN